MVIRFLHLERLDAAFGGSTRGARLFVYRQFHGGDGSGWPGPDVAPPDKVWLTVNGFAAADVEAIEFVTDLDRHEAPVQPDGSFLTLVRARRRRKLRIRLHLTTGEILEDGT